jgi:hypothetical protein
VWGDGVTDREGSCRKTSRNEAGFNSAKVLLIAESDLQPPRHFCRSLASVIYPPTCGFYVLTTFADSLRSSVDIFLLYFSWIFALFFL